MLGSSHALSGATVWLGAWSWATVSGLAHPRLDVLTVGTLVAAGAALAPDLDHPNSRLARAGGPITGAVARIVAVVGRGVHAATKLDADRTDEDGHRTITHTLLSALLAGTLVAGIAGISAGWPGKVFTAVLVFASTRLGASAIRSAFGGRQKRIRHAGIRWRKTTLLALACAVIAYTLVPADVWWLGLAVGVGCATHCAGDVITASGCPVLWPIPIPSKILRYDRSLRRRVPVRVWRTWYLVGSPRWMRFRVGSPTEKRVAWGIVALGALAVVGLIYAYGWGPRP